MVKMLYLMPDMLCFANRQIQKAQKETSVAINLIEETKNVICFVL